MATMRLDIVTAEKLVYSDEVSSVVAPGAEGQLGILPNHAPLLTSLKPGELKVLKEGRHVPRIIVGPIELYKAPTVKVLIRNENRTF